MACSDYAEGELINALDASTMAIRDAALCPYTNQMSTIVFATIVMVGIVNAPIYVRQQSLLIPFVITMTTGGIWVTVATGMAQTLVGVIVLFVIGLGPVLLLRRIVKR